LDKGDHPELDTLELCSEEQISQYQSMIGSLQWIGTIRRFNKHTAVMTMSGFCIAPRIGHLKRLQLIYGYLSKMQFASTRVRILQSYKTKFRSSKVNFEVRGLNLL
jgi:hypothetical protein